MLRVGREYWRSFQRQMSRNSSRGPEQEYLQKVKDSKEKHTTPMYCTLDFSKIYCSSYNSDAHIVTTRASDQRADKPWSALAQHTNITIGTISTIQSILQYHHHYFKTILTHATEGFDRA